VPIWIQLGHALKEIGNLDGAEQAYCQSLAAGPATVDAYLQLGRCLKVQGKTEEAQAAYLRAFALNPSVDGLVAELQKLGWSMREVAELTALSPIRDVAPVLADHRAPTAGPLFSVIIPVHSRTVEFREALDSVLAQSLSSLEIVIVTNGSPQETLDLIDEYKRDDRVAAYYYPDNSGGPCRGRNRGIVEARGEFISFLDSDDLFYRDTLMSAYEAFVETGADVVAGRASWIVDGSRIVGDLQTGHTNQPCDVNMAVLMRDNPFMTCTVHVRRDLLLKYGGFRPEQEYLEDLELWLRLAYHGARFNYSDKLFSQYRLHSGNTELKFIDRKEDWFRTMWQNYYKPFVNWGI
jgi:tetratricopeptide (TPR) repeat protein